MEVLMEIKVSAYSLGIRGPSGGEEHLSVCVCVSWSSAVSPLRNVDHSPRRLRPGAEY